ncbi:MAG: GGDEF domain-containing protein [Phyllobacteriaceae bacterium]|nr:GGDEF domain-containing protein [Phyllobacteriaceae bacterium]
MHFHKAEIAFFLFMLLLAGTAGMIGFVHGDLGDATSLTPESLASARSNLLIALVMLATTIGFGGLFIYPLIRLQAREQGKLKAMTVTLSARSESLQQAALTDALTGMNNRRYFDDALKEYLLEFHRIERPIGLMILDLDHFKSVNDTHGHDMGDEVLRAVAKCLRDFTRYHDVAARLGGEEFAVVAPNLDIETLNKLADRIRRAVAGLTITNGNVSLKVTTSVGLAVWDRRESAEEFFKRADSNLYRAKREGRNRVCA